VPRDIFLRLWSNKKYDTVRGGAQKPERENVAGFFVFRMFLSLTFF
jgi:hypothetical protein